MPRNATPEEPISPAQQKALAALLAGKSVTDAAAAAGVDRTTVHRWLKGDYRFQAALNRGWWPHRASEPGHRSICRGKSATQNPQFLHLGAGS